MHEGLHLHIIYYSLHFVFWYFHGSQSCSRVQFFGPDPTNQGLDPTPPAVLVNIPDPTRPAGRPDPGKTLMAHSRLNFRPFSTKSLNSRYLQGRLISNYSLPLPSSRSTLRYFAILCNTPETNWYTNWWLQTTWSKSCPFWIDSTCNVPPLFLNCIPYNQSSMSYNS